MPGGRLPAGGLFGFVLGAPAVPGQRRAARVAAWAQRFLCHGLLPLSSSVPCPKSHAPWNLPYRARVRARVAGQEIRLAPLAGFEPAALTGLWFPVALPAELQRRISPGVGAAEVGSSTAPAVAVRDRKGKTERGGWRALRAFIVA